MATEAFLYHIQNNKGLKPIVIIEIDGIGHISSGTAKKYKFCSRVPDYAKRNPSYLPILASYPNLLSSQTPPLGGIQTPGQVSFRLLDKKTPAFPLGIVSTLLKEEQSPVSEVLQNITKTSATIRMNYWSIFDAALPALMWIGGECIKVDTAFPFSGYVQVSRAQLGTKAAAHKERTPVFETNNLALGRQLKVFITFDGLSEADETELENGYFVREFSVDDLLSYEIKASSRQDWFSRVCGAAQQTAIQLNSGELADRNRWFVARENNRPNDWLLSGWDRYSRLFAIVEESGEIINFRWSESDLWIGNDSQRQIWSTPRTSPKDWVGAEMKTCLVADRDLTYCSFVYQPKGSESDVLNDSSWIASDHPLIILLCLLCSSAEQGDGLWKNNYTSGGGHFACLAPGWGIGIEASNIDFNSFWQIIDRTANLRLSRFILKEPRSFKELAEDVLLRPFGFVLGWQNGKISVKKPSGFSTFFEEGQADFNETNILITPERSPDIQLSKDTSTLAGEVVFANKNWNDQTNTITFRDADFSGLFGWTTSPDITKKKLTVSTEGIPFAGGGDNYYLETRAAELLYYYARPVWRISWRTGLSFLTSEAGAYGLITHRDLPPRAGIRDWSAVPIYITDKRVRVQPDRSEIEWEGVILDKGERLGGIAPSATISSVSSAPTYWINQHQNTVTGSSIDYNSLPATDALSFQEGYKIRLMNRNFFSTSSQVATITAISGNTITLDMILTGAAMGSVIECANYEQTSFDTTIPQRDAFVYMGQRSPRQVSSGSTDRVYQYGPQ